MAKFSWIFSILPEDKLIGFNEKFKEFSQRKSKKLRDAINCAKKIMSGSTTYEIEREKFKNRTKKTANNNTNKTNPNTGSQSNEEQFEEFSDYTEFTEENFNSNINSKDIPMTRNGYTNPNGVINNTSYLRKHEYKNLSEKPEFSRGSNTNNNINGYKNMDENGYDNTTQLGGRKRQKISNTGTAQNQTGNMINSINSNRSNAFNGTLMTRRRNNANNNNNGI